MGSSVKKIIFLLPYLNVNATSAERFKSFIVAAEKDSGFETEVITFDYGIKRSYFSGLSVQNVDFLYPKNYRKLKVDFNFVQKLAFKCLNLGYFKLWRLFQLLHLILFQTDIFYPGKINKEFSVSNKDTLVVCSGSHFSLFSSGKSLCDEFGYKLIVDYRDPWTFGYKAIDGFVLVQKFKIFFGRIKEIRILKRASLVITVSESLKSFFPKKYQHKIEVFTNGSNFSSEEVKPNQFPTDFNLVYAGTIYNEQLREEVFFSALKKFIYDKDKSRIKLQFLGAKENNVLLHTIKKYDLQSISEVTPRLNREDFLSHMNNASSFFHLRYDDKTNVISSKLSEYLIFKKPIILPVSDNGDIAELVGSKKGNFVCETQEEILETLNNLWERFESNKPANLDGSTVSENMLTRSQIAEVLIKEIKELP